MAVAPQLWPDGNLCQLMQLEYGANLRVGLKKLRFFGLGNRLAYG